MENEKPDIKIKITPKEPTDLNISNYLGFNDVQLDGVSRQADRLQELLEVSSASPTEDSDEIDCEKSLELSSQMWEKITDVMNNYKPFPQNLGTGPFFGDPQEQEEIHKKQLQNIAFANSEWKSLQSQTTSSNGISSLGNK